MVTLYYGEKVTEDEANELVEKLGKEFSDMEFAVYYGGQPHYFYMISLE